ncbi:MAG: tetratricopeptide repeat protein [Verrucomicrobia bacterium]|nr:tetratricopeptide repeat protein [Verrucomicrobiota bacterium]
MRFRFILHLALASGLMLTGCKPRPVKTTVRQTVAEALDQTSASCERCHKEIHAAWSRTDHALANHKIDARDRAAFTVAKLIADGGSRFELAWQDDKPLMTELRKDLPPNRHEPDLILGHKPLWQPLIPAKGGRWQPADLAFDPAKKEWFNVFGQENRQHGEWGHWTGRGMNWNSMCAHCHMTGYDKKYDPATDTFASKWVEHGIGCIQCHGAMPNEHKSLPPDAKRPAGAPPTELFRTDRTKMMHTCAPCHARNELLTGKFQPGDSYHDHYRITLPVEPNVYYPDGQQRDEDFNWTSVLISRMGHAGVTCFDCHDPHTTKTILPATDNNLCMRCHSNPSNPAFPKAPVIDPLAHSRHKPDSTGNQCVTCHMPTTNYMVRAPRHDHGWLKPDPLLTKELGIPNACNRCHTDQTTEWAIDFANQWYGSKLDSHQRARARAMAAAQARQPGAVSAVLAVLKMEDVPAWRATLLEVIAPFLDIPPESSGRAVPARASANDSPSAQILATARESLSAKDPLERSAAVRLLASHAPSQDLLRPLLRDPVRLVRLDAAWALSTTLAAGSPERAELDAYMSLSLDQPSGRLRLGQDLANRNRLPEAQREMETAVEWDPFSPGIRDALGFVLNARGYSLQAAAQFYRAAQLQPADAQSAYRAALSFAEAGRLPDAEVAFRLAVERDPRFDRAWYNLGLLLAQTNRLPDAITALKKAESLNATSADYPYALATVLLRSGDRDAALAAARRTLALDPNHAQARELLR